MIEIEGKIESSKYIDMTIDAVSRFGIKVERNGNVIRVCGNQKYISPKKVVVEGDWSNAAFWASLGAFSEKGITCRGVNNKSIQGDRAILDILRKFGADVETGKDFFTVKKKGIRSCDIDAAEIPDLVPVLSTIAAVADGETKIYNAGRLRIKESDRLATVTRQLNNLGADVIEGEDHLIIRGKERLSGGNCSGENDHRIAMMCAVAAIGCEEPVTLTDYKCVKKSYPGFWNDFMGMDPTCPDTKEEF